MKRLYIVIIFAIAFFSNSKKAVSQSSSSCAQTLRLAQSVYEQGRLQEIQTILVLELRENTYTEIGNFSNDDLVKSSIFNQLNLKVSQVFN